MLAAKMIAQEIEEHLDDDKNRLTGELLELTSQTKEIVDSEKLSVGNNQSNENKVNSKSDEEFEKISSKPENPWNPTPFNPS